MTCSLDSIARMTISAFTKFTLLPSPKPILTSSHPNRGNNCFFVDTQSWYANIVTNNLSDKKKNKINLWFHTGSKVVKLSCRGLFVVYGSNFVCACLNASTISNFLLDSGNKICWHSLFGAVKLLHIAHLDSIVRRRSVQRSQNFLRVGSHVLFHVVIWTILAVRSKKKESKCRNQRDGPVVLF